MRSAPALVWEGFLEMARWLVVVQRGRRDLYDFLRERLEGVPGVEVILDSRARDRRMRAAVLDAERRARDRRQTPSWRDRELRSLGYPSRGGSLRTRRNPSPVQQVTWRLAS
jgi:hypothetical protein